MPKLLSHCFNHYFLLPNRCLGICIIWGAMALFWFVGVHGPSIVEPAIAAIIYANVDANLAIV
ncbi:MAG: PTS transporter subunit EIIC [Holdemanella porci]